MEMSGKPRSGNHGCVVAGSSGPPCFSRVAAVLIVAGLAWGSALAHQPHDVVHNVALSPRFAEDGVVFVTLSAPSASGLLRSDDGGWTWHSVVRGLDHRGNLTDIFIAPKYPEDPMLMVSSDEDGVYRSDDGGVNWYPVNDGLQSLKIKRIDGAYSPSGNLVMLAAGMDGALYRSGTRGERWERVLPESYAVNDIAFSPTFWQDGLVMVGLRDGRILYSADRGRNWLLLPTFQAESEIMTIALDFSNRNPRTIFVGTSDHGIWRSRDNGRSFAPANEGLSDLRIMDIALSPDIQNDLTLFAVTAQEAVYRSVDKGRSWSLHEGGIRPSEQTQVHYFELAISKTFSEDQTIFLGSFEGLYRSEDGGGRWLEHEVRSARLISGFSLAPTYPADPLLVVSRYGGGLYVSEDAGQSWAVRNIGISNSFVYSTESSPTFEQDGMVFAIQPGALLRSGNRGWRWSKHRINDLKVEYPTTIGISPQFASDGTIFVGTRRSGVYRTTNGGGQFSHVLERSAHVDSIVVSPDFGRDQIVFASLRGLGVFASDDGGDRWVNRSEGLPETGTTKLAMALDGAGSPIVFAGTVRGLYLSNDLGSSWQAVTTHPDLIDTNIHSVWPAPGYADDPTLIVILQGKGALKSRDGGQTWSRFAESFIEASDEIRVVRYSPDYSVDGHLFVSTSMRLHTSTDGGETWDPIDVTAMRYEESSQAVYYHGSWGTRPNDQASASHIIASRIPGSRATFLFTGTGVRWVGVRGPALGIALIKLDGVELDPIDCYLDHFEFQHYLLELAELSPGPHQLEIMVSEEKNPESGGYWIVIDAFDIAP